MSATGRGAPAQSATAGREIVISRVIDAPRELVFEAFTEVRHLSQWWGPDGFTTSTRSFEFDRGRPADPGQPGRTRHRDGAQRRSGLMAATVFSSVSMSLDGFIAPESAAELMGRQWMELQRWVFPQRFFRENLKLGGGGEEGRDNDILQETFE